MKKIIFKIISILAICHLGNQGIARTISLASGNIAHYRVVTPAAASEFENFAKEELIRYLNEISNARFSSSCTISNKSIVVCGMSSLSKMTEGKIPLLEKEQYGIFVRKNNIYLVGGCDRAVLYAVYNFLSELGCKWVAPDFPFYEGVARSIPLVKDLTYSRNSDLIQVPDLKYRKLYVEEGITHTNESLLQLIDWMPKLGFNTLVIPIDYEGRGKVKWDNWREKLTPELKKRGILIEVGGHGYQNFMNSEMENGELYKKHPDWFGMDNNGERSKEKRVVFCTSNPEAVEYLHKSILNYLKAHSEIDIFDFWPPDGEHWCNCEKCKETSPTDRHIDLVSKTAQFFKNELPDLTLECLAYSRYVAPPKYEILDKNVLLDFCPIGQNFETQIYEDGDDSNKSYKENLLDWLKTFKGDISVYSYYRKYIWFSLPNIIPHYMQKDVKFYKSVGTKGISIYSEPGDWFAYGPNYYVLGHLAQNPDVNVDELMEQYTKQVFGKAANIALYVYKNLEKVVRFGCRFPNTKQKTPLQYDEYAAKIKICKEKVSNAIKENASDTNIKNHLHRLQLMLEYVSMSIEERSLSVKTGTKEQGNRISEGVMSFFKENENQGIFVIR